MTRRRKNPVQRAMEKQKQQDLLDLAACMIVLSLQGRKLDEFVLLSDIQEAGKLTTRLSGEWLRDDKGNQQFRFYLKEA